MHAPQPRDLNVMECEELLKIGVAQRLVEPVEGVVGIHDQECGVQIPLGPAAVLEVVPPFGELLFVVLPAQVVVLACLGLTGIDPLEAAALPDHLALQGRDKACRRLVGDTPAKPLTPTELLPRLEILLLLGFGLFGQSCKVHILDVELVPMG